MAMSKVATPAMDTVHYTKSQWIRATTATTIIAEWANQMKTREEIITSMCYTYRHDYGLIKEADPGGYTFPLESGMTQSERTALWNTMAQIFDNDIKPILEYYEKANPSGNS